MTTEERKKLAKQSFTWTGDLSNDCTALWAGLMLRAECMEEGYWWWAVYDMQKGEATIDDSNNYNERFIRGEIAQQKAENVAQVYVNEITTRQESGKYLITDTFIITGRGLVFAGYITEGLVSVGDTIEFTASSTLLQRRIVGVEGITKSQLDKVNTGLLIKCSNDAEIDELINWKPENEVATIYKKGTTKKNLAATNSTLTKAGRSWLQKLFGSE